MSLNLVSRARDYSNLRRCFCEKMFKNFDITIKKYPSFFTVEIPTWASVGINVNLWKKYIRPTDKVIFHTWFNDVTMQFLTNNLHCAVTKDVYFVNCQSVKESYGMMKSSADAGRAGRGSQVGEIWVSFESI